MITKTHFDITSNNYRGRRDRMVVGWATIGAISAYHLSCETESHSWRGVIDAKLCYIICQWLAAGWWFTPSAPITSTYKTDHHDMYKCNWNIVEWDVHHHTPPPPSPHTHKQFLLRYTSCIVWRFCIWWVVCNDFPYNNSLFKIYSNMSRCLIL